MENIDKLFEDLYRNFNERKIDLVIANMTTNVKWANGMDGGYLYGHRGVSEYWTRQFKILNFKVTPLEIKKENNAIVIKVHQVVHDLNGQLLADEVVEHDFFLENDKISEFHITKKAG